MTPFIQFTPAVLKRIYDRHPEWTPRKLRYNPRDLAGRWTFDAQIDEEIKKAIDQYNHISPSNEMKDTTPSST